MKHGRAGLIAINEMRHASSGHAAEGGGDIIGVYTAAHFGPAAGLTDPIDLSPAPATTPRPGPGGGDVAAA